MYKHLLITLSLLFLPFSSIAQNPAPTFDGIVSEEEWKDSKSFDINYEISPGNNVTSFDQSLYHLYRNRFVCGFYRLCGYGKPAFFHQKPRRGL